MPTKRVTDSETIITGLTANSGYRVRVQAVVGSRTGPWADYVAFITAAVDPTIPTGLTAGTATATIIPLTWNAVDGATRYFVRWREQGVTDYRISNTPVTSFTFRLLAPGTTYELGVSAVVGGVEGPYSADITATTQSLTLDASIAAPTDLTVNTRVSSSTFISLGHSPVSGATSYITRYRVQGSTNYITFTSARFASIIAMPGTTYEIGVRTVIGNKASPYSADITYTTAN